MFGRTSAAKRLSAVLKTVLGVFIISLSLLSSSLFIQKAYAADETQFEHPDHIIVNVIAERYPLGPDRRPDKTKDTYSSVIATYRITKKGGEVIKCAYPGQEKQFTALVNPKSSEDSWMFYLFIPKNEPGGIANTFLNVSIEEVPTPGFSYRKVETVDSDGDTRYSIYNTRKAGSFAWTKADRENGQALARL
ncbi:hypothetical protein [Alloscardovia omnicolens]|uniref:hypothetical protein n=1 Tax=Alloscardovia omnicolens TaxID=419015 RepID=UPI003A614876